MMPTIQESIQKINSQRQETEKDLKEKKNKAQETEMLLEFFANSFAEFMRQILKGKYDVNVKFPDTQKIKGEVSVEGLTSLLHALNELNTSTKKNKPIDVQKIQGEVTVKNQISIPKVEFPKYPEEISVNNLIDYTKKLDEIKQELSGIEVKPQINVQTEAPQVSIDLEGVKSRLESLIEEIKRIQVTPEVTVDLEKVVDACEKTTTAIKNLIFPVPNFHSSYDHSLSMRSEDMDKTFTYTTDGGKKVVETITVSDVDGGRYRKTYTYSGDGSEMPETESKWERV
jgi:hypothetical protein